MKTYPLPLISIGLVSGYLCKEYVAGNSEIMRLAFVVLMLTILFIIIKSNDIWLKSTASKVIVLITFFMLGNIYYNATVQSKNTYYGDVKGELTIKEIEDKNSFETIYAELSYDVSSVNNDTVVNTKNVVFESFSRGKYVIDNTYKITGMLQPKNIILPQRDVEDQNKKLRIRGYDAMTKYVSKGVDAKLKINESLLISEIKDQMERGVSKRIDEVRVRMNAGIIEAMETNLSPRTSSLLIAMTLGEDKWLSKETKNEFKNAGLSHVLVLSGQNISIFLAALLFVLGYATRVRKVVFLLASLLFYLLSVKLAEPVIRAGIAALYVIMATLYIKKVNIKHAYWIVILTVCAFAPEWVTRSVPFQLSALAVMSIIYFTKIVERQISEKMPRLIAQVISVSISVNILVIPYLLYMFGYYNLLGIISNIIIAPFVFVIVILGTLWMMLGLFLLLTKIVDLQIFDEVLYLPIKILSVSSEIISMLVLNIANFFSTNVYNINYYISFTTLIIYYIIIAILYLSYNEYMRIK